MPHAGDARDTNPTREMRANQPRLSRSQIHQHRGFRQSRRGKRPARSQSLRNALSTQEPAQMGWGKVGMQRMWLPRPKRKSMDLGFAHQGNPKLRSGCYRVTETGRNLSLVTSTPTFNRLPKALSRLTVALIKE